MTNLNLTSCLVHLTVNDQPHSHQFPSSPSGKWPIPNHQLPSSPNSKWPTSVRRNSFWLSSPVQFITCVLDLNSTDIWQVSFLRCTPERDSPLRFVATLIVVYHGCWSQRWCWTEPHPLFPSPSPLTSMQETSQRTLTLWRKNQGNLCVCVYACVHVCVHVFVDCCCGEIKPRWWGCRLL